MISITWFAERSGLPFGTADQRAQAEATVRAWVDAGIVSIDFIADKSRELEIVHALAQTVDGWTPIEAMKEVGTSLRSALKHYDLQVNGQPNELTADVIEVIEAARDGKAAFVKTTVIERAGEPKTYDARLVFGCGVTALDQATDSHRSGLSGEAAQSSVGAQEDQSDGRTDLQAEVG